MIEASEASNLLWFLAWMGCAFGAMSVAESKALNGLLWCVAGLAFGPIALIAACGMWPDAARLEARRAASAK